MDRGDNLDTGDLVEPKREIIDEDQDDRSLYEIASKLQTKAPEEKPKITRLKDRKVKKGARVLFIAHVSNASEAEWYMNGTMIRKGITPGVVEIESESNEMFTLILDTNLVNACEIKVRVFNSVGEEDDETAMLSFFGSAPTPPSGSIPEFIDGMRDLKVKEGEKVSFHVVAKNAERFLWALNRNTIESGKDGMKISIIENTSILTVENVQMRHGGIITATALNDAGGVHSYGRLTVKPAGGDHLDTKPIVKEEEPDSWEAEPAPSQITHTLIQNPFNIPQMVLQWTHHYCETIAGLQFNSAVPLPLLFRDPVAQAMIDHSAATVTNPNQQQPDANEGVPPKAKKRRNRDEPSTSSAQ